MGLEKEEFIGNNIKIINSKNKTLIGLEGKIIDETKNTITIKTQKGNKKILKNQVEFIIKNETITGKKIVKRPEDRLK